MKRLFCLASLCLSACGADYQSARVETVTVKVPVPVLCVTGDIPGDPAPAPKLTGDASRDISIITAIALQWRAVAKERGAMLIACK